MKPREKMIAVILGILVLIWLAGRRPSAPSAPGRAAPGVPGAAGTATSGDPGELPIGRILQIVGQVTEVPTEGSTHNPFARTDPALAKADEPLEFSDLILTGIVKLEDAEPMALVNGQVLLAGEKIGEFEIHEIRDNEVEVTRGLEKHTLQLFNLTEN